MAHEMPGIANYSIFSNGRNAAVPGLLATDAGRPVVNALMGPSGIKAHHGIDNALNYLDNIPYNGGAYRSISGDENDIMMRANEAGYAPPKLEQRSFSDDYKGRRGEGEVGSPLPVDIEGRPLTAPLVAGRRVFGGPDEPLSGGDVEAIARRISSGVSSVPRSELKKGAVGSYNLGSKSIRIADDLAPDQQAITLAHETGHAIDDNSRLGVLSIDGIEQKARKVYHDLRTGQVEESRPKKWYSPELDGYKSSERVREELVAEMFRAYMMDPNYFKTVHPTVPAHAGLNRTGCGKVRASLTRPARLSFIDAG